MLDFIRTTHAKLFQWYKGSITAYCIFRKFSQQNASILQLHLLSLKVVPNVSNESLTSKVLK